MRARHSSAAARMAARRRRRAPARARPAAAASRRDAQGRRDRLRIALADHRGEQREALLAGLQRRLGAHQRVRVLEQLAHALARNSGSARSRTRPRSATRRTLASGSSSASATGPSAISRPAVTRAFRLVRRTSGFGCEAARTSGDTMPRAASSGTSWSSERDGREPSSMQQLLPQHGEPRGLPGSDRAVHVGQIEASRAQLRDERAQVGPPRADVRAEVDERGDAPRQAQPARIRPLEHEQDDAGQRHPGVEHDALEEGPHAPAQAGAAWRCRAASARGSRARCRAARG